MQATTSHPPNEQKPPPTTPKPPPPNKHEPLNHLQRPKNQIWKREKIQPLNHHLKIWSLNHKSEHKPQAIYNIWALNYKFDQTNQKKAKKTHKPILKTQKPTEPNIQIETWKPLMAMSLKRGEIRGAHHLWWWWQVVTLKF